VTPTEKDILGRLDERSMSIKEDVQSVLEQLKKLNSKVAIHEGKIQEIHVKMAVTQGYWKGVNKFIYITLTIIGIAVGAIATMLWH